MQQKTVKEPDHKRSGLKKKAVAAAVLAASVGLVAGSTAQAQPRITNNSAFYAHERESLNVQDVAPISGGESTSNGSITVYTAVELEQLTTPPPPPPPTGYLLLEAARGQLGTYQDCTALVEKALRLIGFGVGDLAPMGFGSFGFQVSADDAQPGDIMMRWGHVAIYAGDGIAVQGGYNGTTVEVGGASSSPYNYAMIIRLP